MKRTICAICVIASVMTSCSKMDTCAPQVKNAEMKVIGVMSSSDSENSVKSFYEFSDDSKSYKTYWDEGDKILVTDGTGTSAEFTATEIESCDESVFSGSYSTSASSMVAVYPAGAVSLSGDGFVVKVNGEQKIDKAGENVEWAKNDLKIGRCSDAQAQTPVFMFKNLLSALEINLKLDSTVSFVDGEKVDYVEVEAPEGTALVGDFNLSYDGQLSVKSATNKVKVTFADSKTLTSASVVRALITVAPCTLNGDLKVKIRTNRKRTIQRTLSASGLEMKAGDYNSINLTKIAQNGAKYFNRFDIPKNLRLYDVSQNGMKADGGEVTVEWDDDIFDTASNEGNRYYTAQIADKDGNIQTACANFQCTASGIYGYDEYVKPRLTIALLGVESTYKVRVKLMWAPDEDYSEWFTFTTPKRYSETQSGYLFMLDFAEVPGYGVGDPVNRCVSTFRGADFCQNTFEAMGSGYDDWANRLHHKDAGVTATYRIGDTGSFLNENTRGSWGSNHYVKNGWLTCGYVFERPGYAQLGSNQNDGSFTFDITKQNGGNITDRRKISCIVEFDACVYNDASNGKVQVDIAGQYNYGPWYNSSGSSSVTITSNGRDHKFNHYSVEVSMSVGSLVIGNHQWRDVTLKISNTDKHRILIDNIQIIKNW